MPPGGKPFRGMVSGSRKDSGSFWIPADRSTVHTLFITESAIDALSAFSMPELRNPGTVFLSTTGAGRKLPAWAEAWKPQRILCAFDADDAGDEAAEALAARNPRTQRLRPKGGKETLQGRGARCIDYFEANKGRMRDDAYRARGMQVGSGQIESSCKQMVVTRFKRSGCKWSMRGANALTALKSCWKNLQWEEFALWKAERIAAG